MNHRLLSTYARIPWIEEGKNVPVFIRCWLVTHEDISIYLIEQYNSDYVVINVRYTDKETAQKVLIELNETYNHGFYKGDILLSPGGNNQGGKVE